MGEHVLDKILSVPFSSLIYTPIILVINYYVAKYTFTESIVSFGIFLSFHILMSASVLLFILFITSGRKSRIFLIKKSKGDFVSKIKEISPLVKMAILLGISAIIFPFIFQ